MRNRILYAILLTLILPLALIGCGGEEPKSDSEFIETVRTSEATGSESGLIDPAIKGNPPTIVPETNQFDMGTIPTRGYTFKDMKIFNRGDAPLTISNIRTQCPCTIGEMVEDTIPAGGEGTMRIRLDPTKVSGYHSSKELTLTSNDPVNPQIIITVTATLEGELQYETPDTLFTEPIEMGAGVEDSLRITQTASEPITIRETSLQGAPEGMSAETVLVDKEKWANAAFPEWDLVIRIAPETKAGHYKPIATVSYDDGRNTSRKFHFDVLIEGIYSFAPQEITLRNVNTGETYEAVTTLSAKVPVTIDSVESANPAIDVTFANGDVPNTYVFNITIPERTENRLQKDEWTIAMTVDGKPVTETIKLVALLTR